MEVISLAHDQGTFILRDVPLHLANAIRRIIIAEVPTLAIDRVFIAENSGSVFDEIIAHRLGLVPLVGDISKFKFPEECECHGAGCPSCEVRLFLDVEALEDQVAVYSGHLKSERADVYPISESIPITVLSKGQRLVLEARARLGTGKLHAKWQPASVAALRYLPQIKFFENCNNCGECINVCPRRVLIMGDRQPKVVKLHDCTFCRLCEEVCELKAVVVEQEKDSYVMQIESVGARSVREIINEACDVLERKVLDFKESLSKALLSQLEAVSSG